MDPRKKDHYYEQAKKEGYVARSAFKLAEIDQKYKLFKQGQKILDLGAAPGSWVQYVTNKVGLTGKVVAVDLNPLRVSGVNVIQMEGDIRNIAFEEVSLQHGPFHAVISDVAPKTTGQADTDHDESYELCQMVLSVAQKVLKAKGSFVCKMYQGPKTKSFLDLLKGQFEFAKIQKPQASRSESREVFFVGTGFTRKSFPKT